ncbi:MAG: hypothetical protein MEP57_02670 [Microvirga sp.]|nr:hypothetical protein [Microvirga sp.]
MWTNEQPIGVMAIWHGVAPGFEAEMRAWYDREHHFERLAVPGFLRVRRYEAEGGGPAIFVRYETRDVGVLSSPGYLARLNDPTPWTRRVQPYVRDYTRAVCVRRWRIGAAQGGFVAAIRMSDVPPPDADLRALAGALGQGEGVLGAELIETDAARSSIATRERDLRAAGENPLAAALIVEATGRAAAEAAAAKALETLPDVAGASASIYRLAFIAEGAEA